MRKLLITITATLMFTGVSIAQDYNTAIGLRFGGTNGFTVKHFISDRSALEGILSVRWKGFNITGLYEIHNDLADVDGLTWYYGFGAHIGFLNGEDADRWYDEDDDDDYMVIGADGIIGLEYSFSEVPIGLSLDWKPAFNIIGHTGFWGDSGGLAIRFIF